MANYRLAWVAALGAPVVVALALVPLRGRVDATNAALVMVLVVVAVAALGWRSAGTAAAVVAGASFDLFFTRPYGSLKIDNSEDVLTTVLLVVVGAAVTELAIWARRQHAAALRLQGYSAGVRAAVSSVDDTAPLDVLIDQVCGQLVTVLGMSSCRFDYGASVLDPTHPLLRADGQVEVEGTDCDVERLGLPVSHDLQVPATAGDSYLGLFSLTPAAGARPSLEQRLAAVTLADRAAAAIMRHRSQPVD